METYDVDCQRCGANIGDAFCIDPTWHQCAQNRGAGKPLESAFLNYVEGYPLVTFDTEGRITGGELPRDAKLVVRLQEIIAEGLERGCEADYIYCGPPFCLINYGAQTARWSAEAEDKFSEENYERAGLVKHTITGRGRGRLGYCFCTKCVEESVLHHCPVCGSELVEVTADQHPGGKWGIRGVRAPAPMR